MPSSLPAAASALVPCPRRTAIVTGATRGLGRRIAQRLAHDGHRVVVNYYSSGAEAKAIVSEIRDRGGDAIEIKADVRDPDQVQHLVSTAREVFGTVDILVNNATGPQPMQPLEKYLWSDYLGQLEYFVKAPVLLAKAAIGEMKRSRWGRIIQIGSEVTELGNANFSAYVAAKAAMVGLTRAWATELGRDQITVNLIAPGWIPVERHEGTPQSALDAYLRSVPLQRFGAPEDVAAAVAYFASDESGFVSGQCLAVNGANTF